MTQLADPILKNGHKENHIEPVKVWKARRWIDENSAEKVSLTHVADLLGMSATHLSEKFKEVTGMNFVEYVAQARFEKATTLLRNFDLRISEIAFAVGFQSLSQFNRVFKKLAGKSPTEYRATAAGQRECAKFARRNA
jgi:AraC-like DNA-binding protein